MNINVIYIGVHCDHVVVPYLHMKVFCFKLENEIGGKNCDIFSDKMMFWNFFK